LATRLESVSRNRLEILGYFAAVLRFRRKDAIPRPPAWFVGLPVREGALAGKPIAEVEVSDDWS
jgi:hypothetical protein